MSYNVDRRIFEGRWFTAGQNTPFRGLESGQNNEENGYSDNMTRATSRFIQKNNVLDISTVSVYYEFPKSVLQKLGMERLRATLYTNDLYTFSSIRIERGTSYPYARSFSFSLTATF